MAEKAEERSLRGLALRKRIADAGLTMSEFSQRTNFGRNRTWRLVSGQVATREQEVTIDRVLDKTAN